MSTVWQRSPWCPCWSWPARASSTAVDIKPLPVACSGDGLRLPPRIGGLAVGQSLCPLTHAYEAGLTGPAIFLSASRADFRSTMSYAEHLTRKAVFFVMLRLRLLRICSG